MLSEIFTDPAQQTGIFGKTFHQYLLGAFQRRFHVRHYGIFFRCLWLDQ